nr:Gfo/Idh/MocA family oxidoreductase [uncultured Pedobacter sp.]
MKKTIRWGILSTAKIARTNVIPALKLSNNGEVMAIASRNLQHANGVAESLGIKKAYGSYEDLLADDEIGAIYNPLPNNLHLKYTLKALKKGKHVLCEKPIALNAEEAAELSKHLKDFPNLKVMEAFMYKFHPQWIKVKELVKSGEIGVVKSINTLFAYYNVDGNNIRNSVEAGGGSLMDIGCYCISFPRFILEQEPISAYGTMQHDSVFKTDFLTAGILNFKNQVTASFTCTTQAFPYQRLNIFGDKGNIEIELPCNAPNNGECKVTLKTANGEKIFIFKANQYQLQCEAFAEAILKNKAVPYPVSDAENNMKVIDAIVKSAELKAVVEL